MTNSLRALLSESIDYAGLFPPARLPLEQAIRNYARYLTGPDAWMLACFVCPIGSLTDLSPFVEDLFEPDQPCRLSVIGRGGDMSKFSKLFVDVVAACEFGELHADRVIIDAIELRLPAMFLSADEFTLPYMVDLVNVNLQTKAGLDVVRFYEAPVSKDRRQRLPALISALADKPSPLVGFKLRTGGLDAAAFPTTQEVAAVITACRDAGIRWKATAGLHHPFGRFDETLGVWTHGFLNVFVAAALAAVHKLDLEQVQSILEDTDQEHFQFADESLAWNEYGATTEQIISARRGGLVSFGSCSFDEPRDDLRSLGLL